ncbi:MAG: hypothetical protein ABIK53_09030 [bacterium]
MNFKKHYIIYLLIGFIILLIPLTWYGAYGNANNMLIAGGDQGWLINMKSVLNIQNIINSWDSKCFLGGRGLPDVIQFPALLLTLVLSGTELSLSLINKCFFVFPFILMCFSIGIYLWTVNLSARKTTLFFITGAFFYLFNSYIALAMPAPAVIFAYCGLPLILAVLERETQNFKNILKKALLINLILFICLYTFMNLCYVGIYIMVIGLYIFLKFIFTSSKLIFLKKNTILFILTLAFFSVIHLFWYSEYYSFYKAAYKTVHIAAGKTSSEKKIPIRGKLKGLRELHVSEGQTTEGLIGHRAIAYDKDRLKGIYRNEFYMSRPIKACSLFLVFVAFSSLFLCKKDKNIIIFSLIALLTSFLGKGTSPPFAVIFRILFKYFHGFLIYRNPDKFFFAYNFAISFLLAASANKLYINFKSEKKVTQKKVFSISVIFLSFLCLFFISQPFWNGKLLYHDMKAPIKPFLCKLPQYWINMRNYINKTPDFDKSRIFVVPDTGYGRDLEWEVGYGGIDVSRYLLDGGVINKPFASYYIINKDWNKHFIWFLFDSLTRNESPYLKNVFNFAGISHILLQNDLKKICSMEKPERYIEILKHQKGIGEENKFGELTLYNAGTAFENINIADELCCVSGGYEGLLAISNFGELRNFKALLFPEQNSVEINKLLLPRIDKLILVNSSFKDVVLNMLKSDGNIEILTSMPEVNTGNYQVEWVLCSRFFDDGLLDVSGFNYLKKIGNSPFCRSLVRNPYFYLTKSTSPLKFDYEAKTKDEYYLFARAGCFPEAADIKLKFANTIREVSLKNLSHYGFRWVNLGKFNFSKGSNPVELTGNGKKIVISEFLLVKVSQYERIMKDISNTLSENKIACEYYFSNTSFGTESKLVEARFSIPDDNKYLIRLFPNEAGNKEVLVDGGKYGISISGEEIYFTEGIHEIISPDGGIISISQIPEKNGKSAIIPDNITYLKSTPTKRILKMSTDLPAEILYFNETFDKGWQAKIDGEIAKKHFVINGFSNGFLFDKIVPGEHKVELEFLPQRGHVVRLWISGVSVLIAIIILIFLRKKRKHLNNF